MSSINSVKNLQILYFSRKNKEIKKLKKKDEKSGPGPPYMYTTLTIRHKRVNMFCNFP